MITQSPVRQVLRIMLFSLGIAAQFFYWTWEAEQPTLGLQRGILFLASILFLLGSVFLTQKIELSKEGARKAGVFILTALAVLLAGGCLIFLTYLLYPEEAATARMPEPFVVSGQYRTPADYGYYKDGSSYFFMPSAMLEDTAARMEWLFCDGKPQASRKNDKNAYDVFLVGPSTIRNSPLGSYIQERLQEEITPETQVYRVSDPSYTSSQLRVLMDMLVYPEKPDMAVLYSGYLDMHTVVYSGVRPGDYYLQGIDYALYESPNMRFQLWLSNRIPAYNDYLVKEQQAALKKRNQAIFADPEKRQELISSTASIYLSNILYSLHRCEQEKITCVVVFDASRLVNEYKRSQGAVGEMSIEDQMIYAYIEEVRNLLRKDHPTLPVYFVDDIFDDGNKESYFKDVIHLTDEGYVKLANEMTSIILKNFRGKEQ